MIGAFLHYQVRQMPDLTDPEVVKNLASRDGNLGEAARQQAERMDINPDEDSGNNSTSGSSEDNSNGNTGTTSNSNTDNASPDNNLVERLRNLEIEEEQLSRKDSFSQSDADRQQELNQKIEELSDQIRQNDEVFTDPEAVRETAERDVQGNTPRQVGDTVQSVTTKTEDFPENIDRQEEVSTRRRQLEANRQFIQAQPDDTKFNIDGETVNREEALQILNQRSSEITEIERQLDENLSNQIETRDRNREIERNNFRRRAQKFIENTDSQFENTEEKRFSTAPAAIADRKLQEIAQEGAETLAESDVGENASKTISLDNPATFPAAFASRAVAGAGNLVENTGETVLQGEEFDAFSSEERVEAFNTAQDVEDVLAQNFGAPIANPVATGKVVGGSVGRLRTGPAASVVSDREFELFEGIKDFAVDTGKQAKENPEAFLLSAGLGAGLGRITSSTGRAARSAANSVDVGDAVPTTSASTRTFDASDIGTAETLDPRTGFGRTPRPGEPTPNPLRQTLGEEAQQARNFLEGDLGKRKATPEEVRQQFDETDILMGRNTPDNDPFNPVEVERTRRDVVSDFFDDIGFQERKGAVTVQRQRQVKPDIESDDAVEDIGTTDVTTPDDRRQLPRNRETSSRQGFDSPRRRFLSRIEDEVDTGPSVGTAAGLAAGLGQGFDDFLGEENVAGVDEDLGQQPVNDVGVSMERTPAQNTDITEKNLIEEEGTGFNDFFGIERVPDSRTDTGRGGTGRRAPLDMPESSDFSFDDLPEEESFGAADEGEFASSITAQLFNIEATEDFDEEEFTGTGVDIRPLI